MMITKQQYRNFLSWWLAGLLAPLPEQWLAKLRHAPDRVTVLRQNDSLLFRRYEGATLQLREERDVRLDDEPGKRNIARWLVQQADKPDLILLLPQEELLEKRVAYPSSSERKLRDILGFDMDKQTPFQNEQVYFDYVISGKDPTHERVYIDLYVVLRTVLQKQLDNLRFLDMRPIAAAPAQGKLPNIVNLIPTARQIEDGAANRQLRRLAWSALILCGIWLYAPLLRQVWMVERVAAQVAKSRTQALQTQILIDQKTTILERLAFLSNQHAEHPAFTRVLQELTRILPDDTWVRQLSIENGELQLHGESAVAASIIQIMEESPYLEQTRFRSPVTKNNRNNKDQYHISATVSGGAAR